MIIIVLNNNACFGFGWRGLFWGGLKVGIFFKSSIS